MKSLTQSHRGNSKKAEGIGEFLCDLSVPPCLCVRRQFWMIEP